MRILTDIVAAVGPPTLIRAIGPVCGSRASVARWQHSGAQIRLDASDAVRVTLALRGGHIVRDGRGAGNSQRMAAGSVSVFAANTTTDLEIEGETDVVQIFIEPSCFEEVMGGAACTSPFDYHDPELRAGVFQLLVAAHANDQDNDLLMESALWRVVEHLVRRTPSYRRERWIGGLAHCTLRRVEELISDRLGTAETPSIAELASSAGLSVHHFIRAFKRSTGSTPHQHVMRRRIECALNMLRRPECSVAEVSGSLGYASPSHFVASFRRGTGVTPGTYRAAVVSPGCTTSSSTRS
jgi:AraC family transcriptional regulator